jgi:hypothetical protein
MSMNLTLLTYSPRRTAPAVKVASTVAFVAGGLLIVWSSYIHFHLWQSVGYRRIPTIGSLFLLQSIAGLVLGLLILAVHRVWTAVLGVGFAVATLVGYFISIEHGLFGFKDSSQAPFAQEALILEIAIIVVLIIAGALCFARSAPPTPSGITPPAGPSPGA